MEVQILSVLPIFAPVVYRQDMALSLPREEFDSPSEYQFSWIESTERASFFRATRSWKIVLSVIVRSILARTNAVASTSGWERCGIVPVVTGYIAKEP